MIYKNSLTNSNGRLKFSQQRYDKNDPQGKEVAFRLLNWILDNQPDFFKKYFGNYSKIEFKIIENFSYGDILIIVDGKSFQCEVECRKDSNFKGNFKGNGSYADGVNIPLKEGIENSNGIYLILNKEEVLDCIQSMHLPTGFIIINTDDIKASNIKSAPLKNGEVDPDNCDNKYKVPHSKTRKYGFNGQEFMVYN